MKPDSFGEFMWEGHPSEFQNVKTELMSLWLEKIPTPADQPTFPRDKTRILYGSQREIWGWFLGNSTELRYYICQASKSVANQLLPTAKPLSYGSIDEIRPPRGPCFIQQPQDVL